MACVTAFTPAERPVPFRGRFPGLGPADDEPCPCGSSRQTRRCHWDRRTQRWLLPVYRPRRTKARTGVARDGCYANVSADCGENVPGHDRGKLSNEHWLSNAILKDASDGKFVLVSDLPFQRPGRIDRFPPKSMGASILCVDHNSSLSGLDKTAQSLVQTLQHFHAEQASSVGEYNNEFDLFNGDEIERWLLKMVWGASEAYPTAPKIRGNIRRLQLADYLFRSGGLPVGWGLYATGIRQGLRVSTEHAMTVRLEESNGELRSGSLEVGGVRLTFAIGARRPTTETAAIYRPAAIFLDRVGTDRHKVAALSWYRASGSRAESVKVTFVPD